LTPLECPENAPSLIDELFEITLFFSGKRLLRREQHQERVPITRKGAF
jgi:hypothetical protein